MLANPKIAFVGSPAGGRDRVGQREESPVGEAVAVDQVELSGRPSGPIIGTARERPRGQPDRESAPGRRTVESMISPATTRGGRKRRRRGSMSVTPSASYSLTLRIELDNEPGMLGEVTSAIGEAGGSVGAIDIVEGRRAASSCATSRSTPRARSTGSPIIEGVREVEGVELLDVTDRTFNMHKGGKIAQENKHPLNNRDDLSMAYTPGRRARLPRDPRRPRPRLPLHDQAQLRGGRLGRLGGARASATSARARRCR